MKDELYDDVMLDEPDYTDVKETKKFQKRLRNSIGWIDVMEKGTVFTEQDKNGRYKPTGDVMDEKSVYDVQLGGGCGMTCDSQEHSEILSSVVQMNERLKRIENMLKNVTIKK